MENTFVKVPASEVKLDDRVSTQGRLWKVSETRVIRRGKAKGRVLIMVSLDEPGRLGGLVLGEFEPTELVAVRR